ncbi:metallophosphoesterase, partial [Barnesiella intestinihominis]
IVQFSDLHLETLGSAANYLPRWINRINQLHPDLIVFTGDLVNRRGNELPPYMNELSRLSAPDGVYSILGNHDYGDYFHWGNPEEKEQTLRSLIVDEEKMGWTMLNNRSVFLHRGNDSIALIGVENWGLPPFPQYGKLDQAYSSLNDSVFKILLSHNPLHWKHEVIPHSNIDLTLSGHTHAMQLKLGWKGFEYSFAEPLYPEWSGLYTAPDKHQMLYVNEGIGCVFLPMRIGARPEITIITLKKES